MPLNKPALEALNQTNFPDNQEQLITPILLREFNDEMINSMELTQSMDSYANLGTANLFYGGNQSIAKEYKLFTNGVYWNNNTAGYNNLEIINSITGNIDIAALGGGVRIVSSSLNIMNGTFTASLAEGFTYVGNSSGRSVLVSTSSFGSVINTGSFATTGSNTFNGSQTISGSVAVKNTLSFPNGLAFLGNAGDVSQISAATTIQFITEPPAGPGGTNDIKFYNRVSGSGILFINEQAGAANGIYYEAGALDFNVAARSGSTGIVTFRSNVVAIDAASTPITASALRTTSGGINSAGALTASLQQGYAWVGNSSGVSTLVATSSFGTSINTGSFATTGSNTFNGIETINIPTGGAAQGIRLFNTGSDASGSMSFGITDPGNPFIQLKNRTWFQFGPNDELQFQSFTSSYDNGIIIGPYYSGSQKVRLMPRSSSLQFTQDVGSGELPILTLGVPQGIGSEQPSIFNTPLVINQTFTASLAKGFTYVGNASNISTLVATSSFGSTINTGSLMRTGSVAGNILTFTKGDATTFSLTVATGSTIDTGSFATTGSNSFRGVENIGDVSGTGNGEVYLLGRSGSLIIGNSTATPTYAALAHLSSSQTNGNTNLIFKPNSNTGDTIISGSGNIFTNPAAVTAGYKRYIGGSNNLYLNSTNGINSQITASAASVSGVRPIMSNNIFNGTGNFSINQATNPGTHTYSQNIFNSNGTTTINALGFTGSLNILANVSSNGAITINAASASVAEIATGISGSGTVNVVSNFLLAGSITNTSPRILLTTNTQAVAQNLIAGASITVTNISASANVNLTSNITNGNISYTNAAATGVHTAVGGVNNCQGAITINAIGSAVAMANGIFIGGPTITNNSFTGSAGVGLMSANRNLFQGQGHTLSVTGSQEGTSAPNFSDNAILGRNITIFSNVTGAGNYRDLNGCVIGGQNLIVSASNSFALTEGGSAFFGRHNANDGKRNKTGQTVFSVGTGISGSTKTGFLIDSGSNSYFEGTLNVSGSTSLTGSLTASGSISLNGLSVTRGPGNNNVGIGVNILQNAVSGGNVALGTDALRDNTSGTDNVALGNTALAANISGDRNMAIGSNTLDSNTTGTLNVAIGNATLAGLIDGIANIGIGFEALKNQTTGSTNVGIGSQVLNQNISGSGNIAFGAKAGYNETGNNNFYINNTEYGSINADRSGSLMWGKMDTTTANQTLQINARTRFTNEVLFTTGSNQQAGTAVLDGANPGTVTVSNSLVTANSIIMLTKQTLTNAHMVAVSSKGAGTFTITSNGNGDADTVGWFIINNS